MNIAIYYVIERSNRASAVQQCVQLDGFIGLSKRRPMRRPCSLAQVSSPRQDKDCESDESELRPSRARFSVARLDGIVQSRVVDAVSKSNGIQLSRIGSKSHFDVSQALSKGQLFKSNGSKLMSKSAGVRPDDYHNAQRFCKSFSMEWTPLSEQTGYCQQP